MRAFMSFVVLISFALSGCIYTGVQPPKRQAPLVIVEGGLGSMLAANMAAERNEIADAASRIAISLDGQNPPGPKEQEASWGSTDGIRAKYTKANADLIGAAFKSAGSAPLQANVWREIAKGFHVSR